MEVIIVLAVIVCLPIYMLYVSISELHAKLDILMQQSPPDWSIYLNEEINQSIVSGNLPKAATKLREKTGLSLKQCLSIVENYKPINKQKQC